MLILTFVVSKWLFRELEPESKALMDVAVAWLIAAILSGFGRADGGNFVWTAGLAYIPGAILVWFHHRRKLIKAWEKSNPNEVFE